MPAPITDSYSRSSTASLIKEVTDNTPLTPTTFFQLNSENLAANYEFAISSPVAGSRAMNIRAVKKAIPAIQGEIDLNIEPKQFGHFVNGVFGSVVKANWIPYTAGSGAFTVGETVTGGTSSKTGVVVLDTGFGLQISTPSGAFTAGETITGGSSSKTATVTAYDASVFCFAGTMPKYPLPTYTLQINYADIAIRYMGVRFKAFDQLMQADNIMTAKVKVIAKSQFRHAKVMAITASGATKTITVDQSLGLVTGDTIRLYRPGTGFMDFASVGVTTNTVATVPTSTTLTVAALYAATAIGDLICLAPQTASYTIGNELAWVGGATAYIGDAQTSLTAIALEDFTFVADNDIEERHGVSGHDLADRFTTALLQKKATTKGSFKIYYQNEELARLMRLNTAQAIRIQSQGDAIGATGINYELNIIAPQIRFAPFQTSVAKDATIEQAVNFDGFLDTTTGYLSRVLLITDVTAY